MPMHPRAQPNFRNLIIRPLWMTLKTGLRTFPVIGKFFRNEYHNKPATLLDENSKLRTKDNKYNTPSEQDYTADRESSDLFPSIYRPVTIMYPYERLEDMEPWLFVPGEYNGRIGVIWETCTACRLCVTICPNDCLHMTTELRVDVMEAKEGENADVGSELEIGGWAAIPINSGKKENEEYDIFTAHKGPSADYRFGEIIDLSGENATIRWNDSGVESEINSSSLYPADDQIVSGRIDIGRCMFCGLCMEACDFSSFFMTNEYDGMSGFTRQDLWFDAERTRVLPSQHQEAVDAELAKRATKERAKREKRAAKAKAKAEA